MLSAAKRHLKFANVMSVIAVFLALGGSAYALQLGTEQRRSRAAEAKRGLQLEGRKTTR